VAQVLEERFAETVETQPELLGHHYTEAGLNKQAVPYWRRAADQAVAGSAHAEAIGHFEKGLAVLNALPETPERAPQEIELQRGLGAALSVTKGYSAPEVEQPLARARALCQQIGDTGLIFPVLFDLWSFHEVRGELQTARELAEELLALAEREQDPALFLQGHRTLADVMYRLGEFESALSHLTRGIALYDRELHRSQALLYGQDPGQGLLVYAALVLWMLGYPDQALRRSEEAITLAEGLSHPYSLGHALQTTTNLYVFRREWDVVQERAVILSALATEQGFADLSRSGLQRQHLVQATQGQRKEEGIAQSRQDIDSRKWPGWLTMLAHLADAYGTVGQAGEGLRLLAEVPAYMDKTGERFCEAELFRVRGELLQKQINPAETQAEFCFGQALDVARRQQARSWELRTSVSLARLWQKQGKTKDARELLEPIYGWFTEGFDTADLKDAKALLEELA
jgi:predicted ATPase